jgi:hypothetical protein
MIAVFALVLVASMATVARAGVTFDASHAFQIFNDDRWEGSNRHFGFMFDLSSDMQAGFFFEEANWDWSADVGQASPNFIHTSGHLNGLRLMKEFSKYVSGGLDLGTAQISVQSAGGTTATLASAAPLNQNKPFVDLLARIGYTSEGQRTTTGIHADIGYRILDINDVTTAGVLGAAGERTLEDLNSILIGLGVSIGF